MQDTTIYHLFQLLQSRGASQEISAQISIWNYQDLFPQRKGFQNLKLIGKGDFGNVYLIDIKGIDYAIKVMTQTRSIQQQELIEEFYKEVDYLSTFRDERIMNLIGVSIDTREEDDYILCYLTDYMQKGNLANLIKEKRLFDDEFNETEKERKKLKLIQQIVEGVHVIHNLERPH